MTDPEFLRWCAARFVRYGESPNVDFVQKLERMANELDEIEVLLTKLEKVLHDFRQR